VKEMISHYDQVKQTENVLASHHGLGKDLWQKEKSKKKITQIFMEKKR
jgi:hypothetical protein